MLSVIIVNYNVRHFLEQCLFSVLQAIEAIDAEIIVVDNASTDGSREYLLSIFGEERKIRFIWNDENLGFGKANNQGLALASGEFVLFLNPDTIIAEDSLQKCLAFMESRKEAGAVGVKMVDGSGKFLKESKRAYPTLATSFFKLSGLASLFPNSSVFARYHLGHLDPDQVHEVDVLAGAFMMVRRSVLEKTGGFDPGFFMYGEDIDLSYRIQKLGFRNFYFPETTIIHFKGESTKRGSLNYVKMFYQAMSTFVSKHYGGFAATVYRFAINIAIWIRAGFSAIGGLVRRTGLPLVDAINTLIAFAAATILWNRFVKPDTVYDKEMLMFTFPAFTLIFLLVAYYAGLYDKQQKKLRVLYSTLVSVLIVLTLYSLLPERYRFSRGIIVVGSIFSWLLLSLNRLLLKKMGWIQEEEDETLGTVIAGNQAEFEEIGAVFQQIEKEQRVLGRIAPVDDHHPHLSSLAKLSAFVREVPVREIIFCQGTISFKQIIGQSVLLNGNVRMRIHACGSRSIVGSDSSRSTGTAWSPDMHFAVNTPSAKRFKRLMDIGMSVFLILGLPVNLFIISNPAGLCRNLLKVLAGRRSWVGYSAGQQMDLPKLKAGVIGPNARPVKKGADLEEGLILLDRLYAREYSVNRDMYLIFKGYKGLGT